MRFISVLIVYILVLFVFNVPVRAIVDPLAVPNNKYGIHIVDQNDLVSAAALVNSTGGDWGYVTLVIRLDDLNHDKWQGIFDHLRRLHLIPLLRLATVPQGDIWAKPILDDASKWAEFLNSLNWITQNRYLILFNEPNHAKEWGGELKPHEYALILKTYASALKAKSSDFFILPAGLDAAAPSSKTTMPLDQYLKFMHAFDVNIFTYIDGWTTHAYPNPNFSGTLKDRDKMSLVSYRHELNLLNTLGLTQNLPVFITETGWTHREGIIATYSLYSADKTATFITSAFTSVWLDTGIVAITPFMLNYQAPPFDHFSWTKPGGLDVYPQYTAVQNLPKVAGAPERYDNAFLLSDTIPSILVNDSVYEFLVTFQNTGQIIWEPGLYDLVVDGQLLAQSPFRYPIPHKEPFESISTTIHVQTPVELNNNTLNFRIERDQQPLGQLHERLISLIAPPSLTVQTPTNGDNLSLLIYQEDNLLKKISPFTVSNGIGTVPEIRDLVPQERYRFVLTKPYYLPRQTDAPLSPQHTTVTLKHLLPLDFNLDGQFTFGDILSALRHPRHTLSLLLHP